MDSLLLNLFISIVAGVISYYICKWLDGDNRQQQPKRNSSPHKSKKNPRAATLGLFVDLLWKFLNFISIDIIPLLKRKVNKNINIF